MASPIAFQIFGFLAMISMMLDIFIFLSSYVLVRIGQGMSPARPHEQLQMRDDLLTLVRVVVVTAAAACCLGDIERADGGVIVRDAHRTT